MDEVPDENELTKSFQELSCCPSTESVGHAQKVIAKFVMFSYNNRINNDDLDEFRFEMFQRSNANDRRNLPPSVAALVLHVHRSAYQAGWVWGNSLELCAPPPP